MRSLRLAVPSQVQSEPGRQIPNVEEMLGLCHELLVSKFSEQYQKVVLTDLTEAVAFIMPSQDQISQQVIDCPRPKAHTRLSDLHEILYVTLHDS